jgi:hypothetical protein
MTPEFEVELRTTVASLRVKTSCQEPLIMALLPTLGGSTEGRDTRVLRRHGRVDPGRFESETAQWIEMMRRALDG